MCHPYTILDLNTDLAPVIYHTPPSKHDFKGLFDWSEMIEKEKKYERKWRGVFSWGGKNGGERLFSLSPPLKRKK